MATKKSKGREELKDLFCHCDVGKEHVFFDELVRFFYLIELHVNWILRIILRVRRNKGFKEQ